MFRKVFFSSTKSLLFLILFQKINERIITFFKISSHNQLRTTKETNLIFEFNFYLLRV